MTPEHPRRSLYGCTLLNIYRAGVMQQGNFFIAIYLAGNVYGLYYVIPDATG
jgi:hypothetical protein